MKGKKIIAGILVGSMLFAVPLFARGGRGFMGGANSNFSRPSGQQLHNGYGDGTHPRPMDGTGFGAKNRQSNMNNQNNQYQYRYKKNNQYNNQYQYRYKKNNQYSNQYQYRYKNNVNNNTENNDNTQY